MIMIKLYVTFVALFMALFLSVERQAVRRRTDERGAVTIEQVLWAVAAIAIVGIVVAAVRAFVTSKAAQIN